MFSFGFGCFGHQVMMFFPPRSYAAIAAHPDCNPLLPDNDGKSDDPEMSIWDPEVQDLNLADFPGCSSKVGLGVCRRSGIGGAGQKCRESAESQNQS